MKILREKPFMLLKSRKWKLDEILDAFHITVGIPEKVWLPTNTKCNDAILYVGGEWEHRLTQQSHIYVLDLCFMLDF